MYLRFEFGRRVRVAGAALAWLSMAACQHPEAEPAALGAAPPVVGHAVGPQPGADRPLPVATNPFADDPNLPIEGRRLFTWFNCEGCHGGHAGGGMGPSLRDVTWLYGNTEQDIFNSIAEGRAYGMPAWGTKLPAEQIWKLVGYIKSLGTEREPDAPPQNRSYPNPPPRRDLPTVEADKS
jgi:cytochrome c oxidase cbb3-type subunit 3